MNKSLRTLIENNHLPLRNHAYIHVDDLEKTDDNLHKVITIKFPANIVITGELLDSSKDKAIIFRDAYLTGLRRSSEQLQEIIEELEKVE